jgi:hypothetical protein
VAPVANAGSDKVTSSNSLTLYGSGSDKDGRIVGYKWIQYGGTAASLSNTTSANLGISGLKDGRYYFRLTVTDDDGATDYDNMMVTVSGSSTPNVAPIANAGSDRTTSSTSIVISGSGTDKDGKIVSYKWTQYGGAATTMTNSTSPSVTVSGLKAGDYYFRITVTDDDGATDYDNMFVRVSKSTTTANIAPVSYAGPDKTISDNYSSTKIYGSATDKDGSIVSYKWTQYGGPDADLINSTSRTLTVSGLEEGRYYLRLTVKDDDGAVDYDNMLLVVNES